MAQQPDTTSEKRAIVTLAIGPSAAAMYELAAPFMQYYARATGAEFVPIRESKINVHSANMEKFQMHAMLDVYDRLAFFDVDILVQPVTPNLFDLVPSDRLGIVYDDPANDEKSTNHAREIRWAQQSLGDVGWRRGYFNSGVMVLSKCHQSILSNPADRERLRSRYADQSLINYNVRKHRVPIFRLDTKLNGFELNGYSSRATNPRNRRAPGNNKLQSYVMHFANEGDKVLQMSKYADGLNDQIERLSRGESVRVEDYGSVSGQEQQEADWSSAASPPMTLVSGMRAHSRRLRCSFASLVQKALLAAMPRSRVSHSNMAHEGGGASGAEASCRRLLLVKEKAFDGGWAGATQRIMDVASGLDALGWSVSIVRGGRRLTDQAWEAAGTFSGQVWSTPFTGHYPRCFDLRYLRAAYNALGGLPAIGTRLTDPERGWGSRLPDWWGLNMVKPPPHVVWGIATEGMSGIVGARKLAERFGMPLVTELQDPIPHPGAPPLSAREAECLATCLHASDLVITTTQALADELAARFPGLEGRVKALYLSYDESAEPSAVSARSESDPFILLHAGTLGGGAKRNARDLIDAMCRAAGEDSAFCAQTRLVLLGAGAGGKEAKDIAEEQGHGELVELRNQVPHDECVRQMGAADVQVVIKSDSPEYDRQIPGKLFQCMGRGKPILGIMQETEAAEILRRSGLGVVVVNEPEPLAEALLRLFRARAWTGKDLTVDWNYIRGFSQSAMASRLDNWLHRLG
ncbi:MAG: hypothetical protein ISS31_01060 [Kiritimatiellae bacterium]|nr:hypothetical protein [Kiritimatiellia bacterium]